MEATPSPNFFDDMTLRRVVEVPVVESRSIALTLLFDPEHNLEERILREQFAT